MKNKSIFSNKLVMLLLSGIVAFGLWLYVITVVSPNSETTIYGVSVELQGEGVLNDRKLIITEQIETVDLQLAGNRTDLNKISNKNTSVVVDVTKIYDAGEHNLSYLFVPPGDIPSDALTIQSKNPNSIRLVVEEKLEKEIPVNVIYKNNTPADFVKEPEQLDREMIVVSGPASVVKTITQAVVEIDLANCRETIVESKTFTLCDQNGKEVKNEFVKTVDDNYQVNVTVPIALFKELPLKLNVTPGGGATLENTKITLSHQTLSVSGPEAVVSGMEEIVVGTVDLGKLKESQTLEFELTLPEGVTNETGVTTVTAEIDFDGLSTRTFHVTQIRTVDLPDGMSVQLSAEVVEVMIRGSAAELARMTDSDITVIVDLSDAVLGVEKYTATVELADGFTASGAVGTYTVTATISQKEA
ncbi:MAG: hypothetical protein IKW10_01345 [Oscillospiraceae bacterium]|nr:hypothetical protein [Oscillospiraceae bacterium]